MSQVLNAEEPNLDAPAHHHLTPTEAEFSSLCQVISSLADGDFEKVLQQRRIHLEEKRLSEYLASSSFSQFRSLDITEIKVVSVSEPEYSRWPREDTIQTNYAKDIGHYSFRRHYAIGQGKYPLEILAWRHHCNFDNLHRCTGMDLTYTIGAFYRGDKGFANATHLSHWQGYEFQEHCNSGLKRVLRVIAIDLGLVPEDGDRDIVGLMELLFGREIIYEWQLNESWDGKAAYSLSNIVINELDLQEEDDF